MTPWGIYGPRRFDAFGGVFELVGLGAGRWRWVARLARERLTAWVWRLLCA